jgi:hypothetical protein
MSNHYVKFFSDPVTRVIVVIAMCLVGSAYFTGFRLDSRLLSQTVPPLKRETLRRVDLARDRGLVVVGLIWFGLLLLLTLRRYYVSNLQVSLQELLLYTAIVAATCGIVRVLFSWMFAFETQQ